MRNASIDGIRRRLSPKELLFIVTTIPVCVCAVAAVEYWAVRLEYELIGTAWTRKAYEFFIDDFGISSGFLRELLMRILLRAFTWGCLCVITFCLGLVRSKWTFWLGVEFVVSIGLWNLLVDYLGGRPFAISDRLVSLLGVFLSALSLLLAHYLRGRVHQ
jgi:hypothetical protein